MNTKLVWMDEDTLPVWGHEEYVAEAVKSKALTLIEGFAVDISEFKDQHPGGSKLLTNYVAKDASKAFYGGILNNHTKSARQIMKDLRIAKVLESKKEE